MLLEFGQLFNLLVTQRNVGSLMVLFFMTSEQYVVSLSLGTY